MGLDDILKLVARLQTSPWFDGIVAVVAAYVVIVLYKLARSEEGFILGYKEWHLGKWQNSAAMKLLRTDFNRLKGNLQQKTEVVHLSRLFDADIAYLMVVGSRGRSARAQRLCEAMVSGVSRVVAVGCTHRAGLLVPEPSGEHLLLCYTDGFTQEAQDSLRVPVHGTVAGHCLTTGEAMQCPDVTTDPLYHYAAAAQPLYRSVLCVPVMAGRSLLGVLAVEAEPSNAFSDDDLLYLEHFAAKLAVLRVLIQRPLRGGGRSEAGPVPGCH